MLETTVKLSLTNYLLIQYNSNLLKLFFYKSQLTINIITYSDLNK